MNRITRLVLFVFLQLVALAASAQVTRVKGVIYDNQSGETMPFVNLLFKGTTIGTTTDINGEFELEAQRAIDTLLVSFLGYKPQRLAIKRYKLTELEIRLVPDNYQLREVVIRPGENPAHRIMREVVAHKKDNNPDRVQSYEYNVYNKIQFDLNNYKEGFTKKKLFKPFNFIFDYADTTEDGKPYLPVAFTETYGKVIHTSDPNRKQETILASKISGIKNASVSQFLGDMYQNVNIYNDFLLIFNKSFVSPITDNFLRYYKYYLVDSVYIGEERCYKLLFLPKRKQDLTFTGNLFIH
ncbi:MAG: carboxypeptidase-like regulatory domain-containing protein, partial [Bacteroidetes bacterium]|nr:carboxypeptidase-like regulatory domain-containing protein [Bacteroidota bacterium]